MHMYVFMLGTNAYILECQLICKATSYVLDDITEIVPLESMSFNFNAYSYEFLSRSQSLYVLREHHVLGLAVLGLSFLCSYMYSPHMQFPLFFPRPFYIEG